MARLALDVCHVATSPYRCVRLALAGILLLAAPLSVWGQSNADAAGKSEEKSAVDIGRAAGGEVGEWPRGGGAGVLLNEHASVDRPAGFELAVDHDPALQRGSIIGPKLATAGCFQADDAAITRTDIDAAIR